MNPLILRRLIGSGWFSPDSLFVNGEKGSAIDFLTMIGAYQDSAGTVPITAIGQLLGRHSDLSGNNNHALQPTSGKRPLYLGCANFDGVDDGLLLSAMPWGNSSQITIVMGIRESYQTYAYGVLFSHAGFNGYLGRKTNDEYELTLYTPAYKSGPYPRRAAQVVDVAFDTVPTTMDEEIIHHVDGQVVNQTVFVNGQTYGQTFATLNQLLGTYTDGSTYPLNGEIYRYICINRALTVQEMADARAWCMAGRSVQPTGLTAELNMFQITGQSLAEGGVGAPVTTVQEYDNVMFTLLENTPSAYVPAVNVTTNLESPMYGQIGHVKALIDGDAGADDYQMLGCNNGVGSSSILIHTKTQATFTTAMSQVVAAKAIADGQGRTFRFRAVSWVQGEADNAMSRTEYQSVLEKLASQYNEQGKRLALQSEDVIFITSQVCSNPLPNVALAQLDAAIAHPLIYMSTPLYPFNHDVDGRHLVAASAKVLGGYMGLVYKRVLIDGVQWEPLRPLSHTQSGNDVTITFNVPDGPLVLDTTLIQAQTNYGFSAADASGVDIPVTSVTLVDTDKVKVTTSAPIPAGGWVNYAQTVQTEPARSLGGCGNLRDSQGDTLTYTGWPMHNWCVMFRHVV
jgi:hypothetical protein